MIVDQRYERGFLGTCVSVSICCRMRIRSDPSSGNRARSGTKRSRKRDVLTDFNRLSAQKALSTHVFGDNFQCNVQGYYRLLLENQRNVQCSFLLSLP